MKNKHLFSVQQLFVDLVGEQEEWEDPLGRKKVFTPMLTMWLMMLQGLAGTSLSGVLGLLQQGAAELVLKHNERGVRAKHLSSNTGGYSRAKSRLGVGEVREVMRLIEQGLRRQGTEKNVIGDRPVANLDGTTLVLERARKIEELFPRGSNVHGKLNHPEMFVVFASDAATGVMTEPQFGPMRGAKATSEQALSAQVIEHLEDGTLIVGDRNFGYFSVVSHAVCHRKDVLLRLNERVVRKFLKGEPEKGTIDKKVVWKKSADDQLLAADDVPEVSGRVIRFTLEQRGFKPLTMYFFTTTELPVDALVRQYGRRVDIETDNRYIKHMFKMERLYSKTPEMLEKELLLRFCAMNLVRQVIANVALSVGLLPRQVSFSKAVMYTRVFGDQMLQATCDAERDDLWNRYTKIIRQCRLSERKGRNEPRKVTRGRNRYEVLRTSREYELRELAENGNNK